ncbi:MAG: hypothetical protein D6682_01465 [Zetaproteobacteria bacterium]|nr:MAG: hypothetical protein D6682_01465 [Zetaproteobacteria bacterium]
MRLGWIGAVVVLSALVSLLLVRIGADRRGHVTPPAPSQQAVQWRGANVLQSTRVSWEDPAALESLKILKGMGADTVILVPFLRQDSPGHSRLRIDEGVTDVQLRAALEKAAALGFRVMIKPQVLVDHGWAGAILPGGGQGWPEWFAGYEKLLLHYADLAQSYHVDALIIGTELARSGDRPEWGPLIRAVRQHFRGRLSYAAHNVDGVERFRFWSQLDAISVTLYPPLHDTVSGMVRDISRVLQRLHRQAARWEKPVWVVEYGIPSASGAASRPWDWQRLREDGSIRVDGKVQVDAFAAWEVSLRAERWIAGYAFWNWMTDPDAGGPLDKDYTIQHKPAQTLLACLWDHCVSQEGGVMASPYATSL